MEKKKREKRRRTTAGKETEEMQSNVGINSREKKAVKETGT